MSNPMNFFKKEDDANGCVNCGHPIIQDEESGKLYHMIRDTQDSCCVVDSKKNTVCKCVAPKLKKVEEKVVEQETEPEPEPVEEEDVLEKPDEVERVPNNFTQPNPIRKQMPENPINYILDYLLEKRAYSVSDANLIIDVCKKLLIDSVKKDE